MYSAVIFNSKLNCYSRYRFWNVMLSKPLTAENDTKMHFSATLLLIYSLFILFHKFQREKHLFITLSIVYIQISSTYLRDFLNILLHVEVNPVWMCPKCMYSAVIFNSKLNCYSRYRFWNVMLSKPLTAENDTKCILVRRCFSFIPLQLYTWESG